jgi:malonyl-CoA O-methyltransferase
LSWLTALTRRRPALLEVRDAYARWAPSYPREPGNELMRLDQGEILRLLPDVRGKRVLDVGCGAGRYLDLLAARGARCVVGVDPERAMLARVGGAAAACAALPRLPFHGGTFDAVVCALVVGHLEDLAGALAEMARVLAPGGTLVYSDVHPEGAARGWRRTFRAADGRDYAVRHVVHPRPAHEAACAAAGLAIDAVAEPRANAPGGHGDVPALLVVRAHLAAAEVRG